MRLSAPTPLTTEHDTSTFASRTPSLDDWLKRRALKNQGQGASRTYVVCEGLQIRAYYALASGAVSITQAPGKFRRNMPDPIPVVMLGRLAVDGRLQGQGVGRGLIRDAGLRVVQAADTIGIRGLMVQVLSHEAKAFYEKMGFEASPLDAMTLMVTLGDLRDGL